MLWNKKRAPLYYASRDFYKKPDDVRRLERLSSIGSKEFSISLIKARYEQMDSETKLRADQTLISLDTGCFFGKI